jgi:sialate O-acetylesterase
MIPNRLNRREFVHAVAGTVAAGASAAGAGSSEPPQAIWNQQDKPGSHPYPGSAQADIWVFSGQSNSQGWGLFKAPVEPDPRIMFFNNENRWVVAQEPLNPRFYNWTPEPVAQNILLQRGNLKFTGKDVVETFLQQLRNDNVHLGGIGPGLFFAKHLVKFIDRPIGLVYCGVGGSPIKSWDRTLTGEPGKPANYTAMLDRIAMVGGRIKGLIWYQGESDAMTFGAEDVYEHALLQLIDNVRNDTHLPDLPFICVQIARFVWPYGSHAQGFEKIRDIQRRVASLRKNVYTVSTLDLPLEDPAHLSFEGHQRLGPRLAEVALSQVYQQAGHATPIDLDTVEVLQPDNRRPMIRVRFKGVNGKLTAHGLPAGFELRSPLPSPEPEPPSAEFAAPVVYRVDFDPEDPAAMIIGVFDDAMINSGGARHHALAGPITLVYGPGTSPYVNVVDEKDIPVPAFGPVAVSS